MSERQKLLKRLAISNEIFGLGYSGKSLPEIESAVVGLSAEALEVPAVWLLHSSGDYLELGPAHGADPLVLNEQVAYKDLGVGNSRQLFKKNSERVVRRVGLFMQRAWSERNGISRVLLAPLAFENELVGVVCMALIRGRSGPDTEFRRALLANAAAVLGRAKKIEMIESQAKKHQSSARRANELVQFARAIDSNDVELIWDRAIERLPKMFSAELVSIFLYDEAAQKLVLKRGYNQDFEGGIEVALDGEGAGGLMATAIRHGAPWLSQDVRAHSTRRNGARYRTDSCLIIPLQESSKKHKLIGVVNFANPTDESGFQTADLDSAAIVGELLGTKVSNALMWAELQKLAITDSLTGLFVHGYFKEALERELMRAERFGKQLSLLMIDVDLFKQINDIYGHPAGDRALVSISSILAENVRDNVDVVARYGGEEFAIILLETMKQSAKEVAERVRAQVSKRPLLYYVEAGNKRKLVPKDTEGAKPFHATISIGVASFPGDAKRPERLIDIADAALYEGKSAGGNKVVLGASSVAV